MGNLVVLRDKLQPHFAAGRYQDADRAAALREPVDEFFENVMVNAEDKDVRINRLTLLSKLRELFLQVADISAAVSVSTKNLPQGRFFYT